MILTYVWDACQLSEIRLMAPTQQWKHSYPYPPLPPAMSHLPHLKGPPAQPETLYYDYCGFYHDYPHLKKSHI